MRQAGEIVRDADRDQTPESDEEAALLHQVGFARLPDGVGNRGHRGMHGEPPGLDVLPDSEQDADAADGEAGTQHRQSGDLAAEQGEGNGMQVGELEIGFAGAGGGGRTKQRGGERGPPPQREMHHGRLDLQGLEAREGKAAARGTARPRAGSRRRAAEVLLFRLGATKPEYSGLQLAIAETTPKGRLRMSLSAKYPAGSAPGTRGDRAPAPRSRHPPRGGRRRPAPPGAW